MAEMSRLTLIKKSILAGALIAIGGLFSIAAAAYGPVVQGLCFSVGLFGVMCAGALLFTGQVLAVHDVWDAKRSVGNLLAFWGVVWALNLVGALCVALLAQVCGFDASAAAAKKAALPWENLLARAVFCNVLVCLAVWIYKNSDRSVVSASLAALLPVACFIACGFEHSVANMFYLPLGLLQGAVSPLDCVRVIGLATLGNIIGGIAFAWLVYIKENKEK